MRNERTDATTRAQELHTMGAERARDDAHPRTPIDLPHRRAHSIEEMCSLVSQAARQEEAPPFCLIVCELPVRDESLGRSQEAAALLAPIMRVGDLAGRLSERSVAVLVPHANADEVRPVVARVQRLLPAVDWRLTVLTFPRHRSIIERLASRRSA